ncbi:MAG: glycosyltransferase family 4 protein [Patescibacteria group bacterium]
MRKIFVKPLFGAFPFYQDIINYPPENVFYVDTGTQTKQGEYYQNKKTKEFANRLLNFLKIPRMMYVKPKDNRYQLIHSSRGILPLNRRPWVLDIEHVYSFTGLHDQLKYNKRIRRIIEKKLGSKYCKKILCHCDATRRGFFRYLDCSKFKDKIIVSYPTVHRISLKKKKSKKIRILCVLSLFRHKAGIQALKAFSKLEKKYNVELIMRADVPPEVKSRFNSKNIIYQSYHGQILTREELLKKVYANADIFLYPSLCDSFGASLLDAMCADLPIVSTNLYAIPEIVTTNGIIVKIPGYRLEAGFIQEYLIDKFSREDEENFVKDLANALEKLIKNKKLRENMSKESKRLTTTGKFSIAYRNKKLREIYEEALK